VLPGLVLRRVVAHREPCYSYRVWYTCDNCGGDASVEITDLGTGRSEVVCETCAALRHTPADPLAGLRAALAVRNVEQLIALARLKSQVSHALNEALHSATLHLAASGVSRRALARALGVSETRVSQIVHGADDRRRARRRLGARPRTTTTSTAYSSRASEWNDDDEPVSTSSFSFFEDEFLEP
jgi:hypothetical protein